MAQSKKRRQAPSSKKRSQYRLKGEFPATKRKKRVAEPPELPREISASNYLTIVWKYLTQEFCEATFLLTRDRERQRKWSLFAILRTWIGLLQCDVGSQTEVVQEYCGKGHPLFPNVKASPESFFLRVQSLRPAFFANLFAGFTNAILPEFPANFQQELGISVESFPEIYAIDASRIAKVGRHLKVARTTTKAIIPGSMQGVYDLRRGCLRELWFDPDGARSEMAMLDEVLPKLPSGALLVNDRYYPKPVIWEKIQGRGLFMVCRYNATVSKRKVKTLARVRKSGARIDDHLVEMGGSRSGTKPVLLRRVRVKTQDIDITLITHILDPERLSVDQLLTLYRQRWSIERMYLHLKEVLALNRLFNASPPAVAQQVYATAILYNALRLSQAQIASRLAIHPEAISPDKLFPRLIEKMVMATVSGLGAERQTEKIRAMNPDVEFKVPEGYDLDHPIFNLDLRGILREKRNPKRRKRRYCKGRKTWTTYRKIAGAKKYLRN